MLINYYVLYVCLVSYIQKLCSSYPPLCFTLHCYLAFHPMRERSNNFFYNGNMLLIMVCIKEYITCIKFNQNAGRWPNVRLLVPLSRFYTSYLLLRVKTSGARYCLVLMIFVLYSPVKVALPKSISLILFFKGRT